MKWKAYGRYGSVGFELVVSMAVGYFFGKWLDGKLLTGNWMTGIFSVVGVYALTHAATEEFNAMIDDEIDLETVAREAIAADILAILAAYGHGSIDIEEAIAPREW